MDLLESLAEDVSYVIYVLMKLALLAIPTYILIHFIVKYW